ncbi:MAG: hypothetical protein F6K54_36745 [Okeania sp. SIO3B5]|uniref:hypothetical protein n=1 Tax=Okeania sp. SIO3B5 TaxID=2607811 RepID=UPI001400C81D|nr:hypothetical protein [Okeania sp. SIO3B5]NEO58119.1 hypothetical protein [Okeania sp. SIO3B5]
MGIAVSPNNAFAEDFCNVEVLDEGACYYPDICYEGSPTFFKEGFDSFLEHTTGSLRIGRQSEATLTPARSPVEGPIKPKAFNSDLPALPSKNDFDNLINLSDFLLSVEPADPKRLISFDFHNLQNRQHYYLSTSIDEVTYMEYDVSFPCLNANNPPPVKVNSDQGNVVVGSILPEDQDKKLKAEIYVVDQTGKVIEKVSLSFLYDGEKIKSSIEKPLPSNICFIQKQGIDPQYGNIFDLEIHNDQCPD